MDKVQVLERYYNSFIDLTDSKGFFLGIADYFDYLQTVPEFDQIGREIRLQEKSAHHKLQELHDIALTKVKAIHDEFWAYCLQHNFFENQAIKNIFKDYDDYVSERTASSRNLADSTYDDMIDIA